MRTGLIAALVGGLALAGCTAYPYGTYGYGSYGYGYGPYGYGYSPGYYSAPAYVGVGGGSYYYGRPYAYNRSYNNNWNGGGWHGGNWNNNGWHGGNWNGGGWHGGGNVYSRSSQPAQRAATPQTRSFEHALGFVPNP